MPITRIAHCAAVAQASSPVTSSAINTTGANFIIVVCSSSAGVTPVLTDSKGNSWTGLTLYGTELKFFYCFNPTVGSGHTFTNTAAASGPGLVAAAYAGVNNFQASSDLGHVATATTNQPGSVTPGVNGCLVVTGADPDSNGGLGSVDSPFAIVSRIAGSPGSFVGVCLADEIQTTATARNPTWTKTGTVDFAVNIAVFQPFLEVSASESFSFSDTFAGLLFAALTLSESFSFSDSLRIMNNELSLHVTDTLSLSDSFGDRVPAVLALGDSLNLTDALQLAAALRLASSEVLALTDAIVFARNNGLSLSDTITLSDAVVTQLNNNLQLQLSDTITIQDALSVLTSTSFINYLRRYLNDVQR